MNVAPCFLDRVLAGGDGDAMFEFARDLYPICRSITGDGLRETLTRIGERLPLTIHEVASGTQVFDWTIPKEWNIRDAWIKGPDGKKVVDFEDHNLHIVGYSIPIHQRMSLESLRPHLHSLPDQPDLIPYRTSYYSETWGFCISQHELDALPDGEYEVFVDTTLEDGSLTYGECRIQGELDDEVLLSAHSCHPSLANDNLSGIALLTALGQALAGENTRYSYRLVFAPGTIGSITWLARNQDVVGRITHGLAVSCVGDSGAGIYKRSRRGNAIIDRAMESVLRHEAPGAQIEDFSPYGYDERQYCSPGFNLPVGLFERSKFGKFPEYHTSADNLDFIAPEYLAASFRIVASVIDVLENDRVLESRNPYCEPQLGRRGLYQALGGDSDRDERQMAMLWVLNLSDGDHSLLDMAERSGLSFAVIRQTAQLLEDHELVRTLR
jgi:aminopeptidase-like protein